MGNGDAIAKTGGAQLFAGHQAFENVLAIEVGQFAGDQVGDLFEYTLFAAARHAHKGAAGGQDIFKSNHGLGWVSASCSALQATQLLFLMFDELAVEFVGE